MRHLFCIFVLMIAASHAQAGEIYFNVAERKALLQSENMSEVKSLCLLPDITLTDSLSLEPIEALQPKEGYGSSREANQFMWHVMVLGSRALGGDEEASQTLQALLIKWAEADAFAASPEHHDPYYALKRIMMPVMVSYSVIREEMSETQSQNVLAWIEKIVRPLDKKFGGHIDKNNHRYLADATLMALGKLLDDEALIEQGVARYKDALHHASADGELPMETRRGARAVSYLRHALTSLTAIAAMEKERGSDLYSHEENGRSMDRVLSYFLSAVRAPEMVRAAASENEIPGPESNYFYPDLAFLDVRGHGHHYMAFSEIYIAQHKGFTVDRLVQFFEQELIGERPLIDGYAGGNVSCFFGEQVNSALQQFEREHNLSMKQKSETK